MPHTTTLKCQTISSPLTHPNGGIIAICRFSILYACVPRRWNLLNVYLGYTFLIIYVYEYDPCAPS